MNIIEANIDNKTYYFVGFLQETKDWYGNKVESKTYWSLKP